MSQKKRKEFLGELDKLYKVRTNWLRSKVFGSRPGKPPKMTRAKINRSIARLQSIASEAVAEDFARTVFNREDVSKKQWHPKRGKGWSRDAKKKNFKAWYQENFGGALCVYVFWNNRRCLYVGKSTKGKSRPANHFEKHWFNSTTRIDIYSVTGIRVLPKLECLAIHHFQPLHNKQRAETKKWTSKCPLCELHQDIESEMHDIFSP